MFNEKQSHNPLFLMICLSLFMVSGMDEPGYTVSRVCDISCQTDRNLVLNNRHIWKSPVNLSTACSALNISPWRTAIRSSAAKKSNDDYTTLTDYYPFQLSNITVTSDGDGKGKVNSRFECMYCACPYTKPNQIMAAWPENAQKL